MEGAEVFYLGIDHQATDVMPTGPAKGVANKRGADAMALAFRANGEALKVSTSSGTTGDGEAQEVTLVVGGYADSGDRGGGFGQQKLVVVHFPALAEGGEIEREKGFGVSSSESLQVGADLGFSDGVPVEVVGKQGQVAADCEACVEEPAGLVGGEGRSADARLDADAADGSGDVEGVVDEGLGERMSASFGDNSDLSGPAFIRGANFEACAFAKCPHSSSGVGAAMLHMDWLTHRLEDY